MESSVPVLTKMYSPSSAGQQCLCVLLPSSSVPHSSVPGWGRPAGDVSSGQAGADTSVWWPITAKYHTSVHSSWH